jgi:hypothetical protein
MVGDGGLGETALPLWKLPDDHIVNFPNGNLQGFNFDFSYGGKPFTRRVAAFCRNSPPFRRRRGSNPHARKGRGILRIRTI